jgi:putative salt-induced outer membrane protein
MFTRFCWICLFYLLSVSAHGDEKLWQSEIAFGMILTTGNTDEENLNGHGDFTRDAEKWRINFHLDALRSSKDEDLTAQKLYESIKSDYKYSDDRYFFTRVSYEDDRFSGFDYQVDLTVGYGQSLLDKDKLKLKVDVGPGNRWSELNSGASESEAILRIAGDLVWKVSKTAEFEQKLSTEIGNESTISRSVSSLKSNIFSRLAMQLSYAVKHNSEVPVGSANTDTETSLNLVYSF